MPWTFWVSFMVLVTFGFAFQPQRYPNNMEIPFNPNQQQILLSSGIPPPFIGNLPSGMTPSRQNMNSRNLPQQQLNQGRQLPQNSIQSNQQLIYEVREEDEDRIPSPIDMLFPGLFNDHEDVEWKDWMENSIPFGSCEAFLRGLSFIPAFMTTGVFGTWALDQFCQEVFFRIVIPVMGKTVGHEYKDWVF